MDWLTGRIRTKNFELPPVVMLVPGGVAFVALMSMVFAQVIFPHRQAMDYAESAMPFMLAALGLMIVGLFLTLARKE